jgi:hypothetical protein
MPADGAAGLRADRIRSRTAVLQTTPEGRIDLPDRDVDEAVEHLVLFGHLACTGIGTTPSSCIRGIHA